MDKRSYCDQIGRNDYDYKIIWKGSKPRQPLSNVYLSALETKNSYRVFETFLTDMEKNACLDKKSCRWLLCTIWRDSRAELYGQIPFPVDSFFLYGWILIEGFTLFIVRRIHLTLRPKPRVGRKAVWLTNRFAALTPRCRSTMYKNHSETTITDPGQR